MIIINSWNDGFETHDSRRIRGKLPWVRQSVMLGDVLWAKLWLRKDAAQIWAGWTSLVWCSAQSETRGTVESAEDVSLLSRVPIEMVKIAIEWAVSCGLAETCGETAEDCAQDARNMRAGTAQDARNMRAGTAQDARNMRTTCAATVRYGTVRDETVRDKAPRAARVSFSPGMFDALIPDSLTSIRFIAVWHDWVNDRHDRKKTISEKAAKIQLESLEPIGVDLSIDCIRASIAGGWQGLFPDRMKPQNKPGKTQWTGFDKIDYLSGTENLRKDENGSFTF